MAAPIWACLLLGCLVSVLAWPAINPAQFPHLPPGGPQPVPAYMVSNVNNEYGVAPDKGTLNGPVTTVANITDIQEHKHRLPNVTSTYGPENAKRQTSTYWLPALASLGSMPLAPSGYHVYRSVRDYGAKGDGKTDDTIAINNAIVDGNRCGNDCGSTSVLGAVIYFPPGRYMISSPIVQYYYTQFIGDATSMPTIAGMQNFTGIALIDTDVYIPGGSGAEWWINQNQFYRQIRNFEFDMTSMPYAVSDNDQQWVPTGLHWQVAQATSLQNLVFTMNTSTDSEPANSVGIFMENGSGGFMSDITFYGGNVGFRAGTQQYTARNLSFTNSLTAISTIWDWGFTWQQITVNNCWIAFNVSSNGGSTGQGTGSISVVDSAFYHVPYAINTHAGGDPPAMVLDNLFIQNSAAVVLVSGGATIFDGSAGDLTITSWAMGRRYTDPDGTGSYVTGLLDPAPVKPISLLDGSGMYFTQSRPQYQDVPSTGFVVATQHSIANDGTGDQSGAINTLLSGSVGTPIFFPAGIYQVQNTVYIPVGSIIVGSAWSQIMGTGSFFEDVNNPQVMVRVGNPGDQGVMQISDMLFTVKGPTAGAILVEWNVHESTQGSAAMWDSHFRVGGAAGTDLQLGNCPTHLGVNENCLAASMLLHVTPQASGYFENIWAWVADHDLDNPANAFISESQSGVPENVTTQISVYAGRGVLIESQGPCWFYGTASEHSALYQYQLNNAKDIYLGHLQTETPYYQPDPEAIQPFQTGGFPADPTFSDCSTDSCVEAWALRIVDSSDVLIYSAGMYSWFSNYDPSCEVSETCQERIMRVEDSDRIWVFNIFTKGIVEVASGFGDVRPIFVNDSNQSGYTSEVSVWLPLAGSANNSGNGNVVYIDPTIWAETDPIVECTTPWPCTLVLPPTILTTATTISFPPLVVPLEVGWTTTVGGSVKFTAVTTTTTVTIPPVTTTEISYWNVPIYGPSGGASPSGTGTGAGTSSSGTTTPFIIYPQPSIDPMPFNITDVYPPGVTPSATATRIILPPPWPYTSITPTASYTQAPTQTLSPDSSEGASSSTPILPFFITQPTNTISPVSTWVSEPTTTVINGKPEPVVPCWAWFIFFCPPNIGGFVLFGWELPGIYPPGPPPGIGPMPGITLPPIPWPTITIGPDVVPTYTPDLDPDEEQCDEITTSFCTTTTSYAVTVQARDVALQTAAPDGRRIRHKKRADTVTTATYTMSTCVTAQGCSCTGEDSTTEVASTATPEPTRPYVIYPNNPTQVNQILAAVNNINPGYTYTSTNIFLGTLFIFVNGINATTAAALRQNPQVQEVEIAKGKLEGADPLRGDFKSEGGGTDVLDTFLNYDGLVNHTADWGESDVAEQRLWKRSNVAQTGAADEMTVISWPRPPEGQAAVPFSSLDSTFNFDSSGGQGVFIYSVDYGAELGHVELSAVATQLQNTALFANPYRASQVADMPSTYKSFTSETDNTYDFGAHGTRMLAKMVGKECGLARNANVKTTVIPYESMIAEHWIDGLQLVYTDIHQNNDRGAKSVVNLSINFQTGSVTTAFINTLAFLIRSLIADGVVVTTGTGNSRINIPINGYPALFKNPADANNIPDLLLVGASQQRGWFTPNYQASDYVDTSAPAEASNMPMPYGPPGTVDLTRYGVGSGTSISSATVAGLAAYFRGLNPGLTTPRSVINLITSLSWSRTPYVMMNGQLDPNGSPKLIWNGQVNGAPVACITNAASGGSKRQTGGSCSGYGASGSPGGGQPFVFQPGDPSPTCTAGCGSLCTGFFCSAPCSTSCPGAAATANPDFLDPADPGSPQNPDSPNYGSGLPASDFPGATACNTVTVTSCSTAAGGSTTCFSTEQCSAVPAAATPTTSSSSSSHSSSPPSTITTTPNPTTGLAVAAYTVCQAEACEYQWEIFTLASGSNEFPGCSTEGALYSSVVSDAPNPTAIPRLGPFSIDGKQNCYFEQDSGPSCIDASDLDCLACFPNGALDSICVGDGVSCNEYDTEGYNADVYCYW